MTHQGKELFKQYKIDGILDSSFEGIPANEVRRMVTDLVYQIEVLHRLGYVNCTLNLNSIRIYQGKFSLTEFMDLSKENSSKPVPPLDRFNVFFSPDAVFTGNRVCKRDDLESLLSLACFLESASHPLSEFISQNNHEIPSSNQLIDQLIDFRRTNQISISKKIKQRLNPDLHPILEHINCIEGNQKPNYKLILVMLAKTQEEEQRVFNWQPEQQLAISNSDGEVDCADEVGENDCSVL